MLSSLPSPSIPVIPLSSAFATTPVTNTIKVSQRQYSSSKVGQEPVRASQPSYHPYARVLSMVDLVDLTETDDETDTAAPSPRMHAGASARYKHLQVNNNNNAQAGPSALPLATIHASNTTKTTTTTTSGGGVANTPVFHAFIPGQITPYLPPTAAVNPEPEWESERFANAQRQVLASYHCRLRVHGSHSHGHGGDRNGKTHGRQKGKDKNDIRSSLPCDAILANYDLLVQHVRLHIARAFELGSCDAVAVAVASATPSRNATPPASAHSESSMANDLGDDDFLILPGPSQPRPRPTPPTPSEAEGRVVSVQCGWINCKLAFNTPQSLEEHLLSVHLEPKVRSICPLKGCTDSPSLLNPGDIRAHIKSSHPQLSPTSLETAEAFSLSPYARQTPPQPPPLDAPALRVQSLSTVPAYLVSSPIIHPFPKGTPLPIDISRANSPPFSRYHNYSHFRRQPPRLAQIGLPIVPDRTDEDVPFHPTCGEASPGYFVGFSCSIFPPNKAEDGLPVMQSLTDRKGRPIVPTSSRAGQHPFTIRKKATGKDGDIIPGRPRLIVPADVYAERQKTIDAEKKMRLKRRLRRKMLRNDWETKDEALKATLKKLSHEQTRRAGMRLAAKKVGSSVGYAFWKEVVRFEAEVIGAGMDVEVGEGEGDGDVKVEADIEMEGDDDVAPNSRDGMSSRSPAHDGAEESLNDFDRGESESKLDLTPDFGAVPEGNASNAKDNDNNANIDVYETKNGEDYIDGDSIADGKKDGDGEANAIEVD